MEDTIDIPDMEDILVPEVCMTTDTSTEANEKEDIVEIDKGSPSEIDKGSLPETDKGSPSEIDKESPSEIDKGSPSESDKASPSEFGKGSPSKEQNGGVIDVDEEETNDKPDEVNHDPTNTNQENENPNQVPENYTPEEMIVYQRLFGAGQQAVQFLRMHCTACNVHLGSAPNKHDKRYIHPLLKVLICKECFDFYGSGDFDKDEDGSELYCRWCGQGGKVLCCAQCPYVFCQKCIRTNLGKKVLETVKESDDWTCFVCRPEQIINLRIICRALYNFVQEEIRLAAELQQPQRLILDGSMCCHYKPKSVAPKRKQTDSEILTYDAILDSEDIYCRKKKIKSNIISHMLTATNENKPPSYNTASLLSVPETWESQVEDEVVCTPDLSMLMDDDESSLQTPNMSPLPQPSSSALPYTTLAQTLSQPPLQSLSPYQNTNSDRNISRDNDVQYIGQTRVINVNSIKYPALHKAYASTAAIGYKLTNKPAVVLNTSTNKPITATSKYIPPNLIQLQIPSVKFSHNDNMAQQPILNVVHNHNNSVIDTTVPARLAPGLRYEWFEKATQFTARVNQNLSTRLCSLSKDQNTVTSLEGLAGIHNNLQEILSNSINSLMQIRKNLRTDFIAGLKKLKFCKMPESNPQPETFTSEDSDVIIIDGNASSESISSTPINNSNEDRPHGYIKVKPASELLEASIITISDDNAVANNILPVGNNALMSNTKSPITLSEGNSTIDAISDTKNNTDKAETNESPTSNDESSASNYINTKDALSEISEILNPETVSLIKKALVESKFETIVNDNLKIKVDKNISKLDMKRMLSVRVILETNFGSETPRTRPRKGYRAMDITPIEEQDIEQMLSSSIVVNNTKKKAFDDSFSAFIANIANQPVENVNEPIEPTENLCESHVSNNEGENEDTLIDTNSSDKSLHLIKETDLKEAGLQSVSENDEVSQDPQTTDSGIDVDGEQSLSNGVLNCQDN